VLPARLRLYFYLQYKTRRGAKPWVLTKAEATALGLPRQNKMRDLRLLETQGLITVITRGMETATISVTPQPLVSPSELSALPQNDVSLPQNDVRVGLRNSL